ncbi:MAG: nucleotidyltransferase domain-containing protein [Acidobacteria bacterium]|nr:nucleotidyltransferase domain-containing protein [Acidobacteriota bacterium]MBI3471966.1 nucleotidyltransferase domain-containing protein [Candidatus Solibacter usitatus]
MERKLDHLVERLKKVHGDRLVTVVLYGSAAAGDHHERYSDLNILCVLTQITPRELADSEQVFRWWRDLGNPAPLLLSEHELRTSTDCFAIEFHDITRRHRVLYGSDIVSALPVDDSFYRAQVEHELRAKLLRLRQKASGILSDKNLLRQLLADSVSTFCVLFRHALALHGVDGDMKKRDLLSQARQQFGIDAAPFEKLLDLREGKIKPGEIEPGPLLDQYLKEISAVIDAVDRLQK